MEAATVAPDGTAIVTVTVASGTPCAEQELAPVRVKVPSRCNMSGT